MEDFGIKVQPYFLHVNKDLLSQYMPKCERVICSHTEVVLFSNDYRVKIYFIPDTSTYVATIYDQQIERNNEYLELNEEPEDSEICHITVVGIDSFHSLLERVYDKLVKLYNYCI